jgi:hypothetical protein
MKRAQISVAMPVKVIQNTVKNGSKWGKITCAQTGTVLHTGKLPYIQRIAKSKYNTLVKFA